MQITPRYDGPPIITMDGDPAAIAEPLLRQRRRLAHIAASLTNEQWDTPSRCEEWRLQDVIEHLVTVDQFWNLSIASGLAGTPTRFLATFDPMATPAAMVDGVRGRAPSETLDAYVAACDALCATVESLTPEQWLSIGEAPVGHVDVRVVAHHALWDCWVHERDMLLPLGVDPDREDDEVAASLRYAATLGPAFSLQTGARVGSVHLAVRDPDVSVSIAVTDHVAVTATSSAQAGAVDAADAVDAVELLEALSVRGPWPAEVSPENREMLAGLDLIFDAR